MQQMATFIYHYNFGCKLETEFNNTACTVGSDLPINGVKSGTGGKPLCTVCARQVEL